MKYTQLNQIFRANFTPKKTKKEKKKKRSNLSL